MCSTAISATCPMARFSALRSEARVTASAPIVAKARSEHGSDCPGECAGKPMGRCRCMRVLRLRVDGSGDWLLVFGDCQEGKKVQLQGPYHEDTELSYGGGFWCKVNVGGGR